MSNMTPVGIPPQAVRLNPGLRALHIGPPPGLTDKECGTVEALVGNTDDGFPVYADYWQPTEEQLLMLIDGAFLELRQYSQKMIMHSLAILPAEATNV